MKSCSTDDQLGSAHGPRTVPHEPHVARFCPERNPTGMYQPTAGFTGRAPVSASAGVPCGRTDSSFVLRIRNSTKQQPRRGARGPRRREDAGRHAPAARPPAPRPLGGPLALAPANADYARYRIRNAAKPRAYAIAPALAGNGRSSSTRAAAPPAARRAHVPHGQYELSKTRYIPDTPDYISSIPRHAQTTTESTTKNTAQGCVSPCAGVRIGRGGAGSDASSSALPLRDGGQGAQVVSPGPKEYGRITSVCDRASRPRRLSCRPSR